MLNAEEYDSISKLIALRMEDRTLDYTTDDQFCQFVNKCLSIIQTKDERMPDEKMNKEKADQFFLSLFNLSWKSKYFYFIYLHYFL